MVGVAHASKNSKAEMVKDWSDVAKYIQVRG